MHTPPADSPAPRGPAIILARPQMGENIGAAARAMWNFGLDDLRLVAPRDGWPNDRAIPMASGATHVLDNVRVYDDVAAATADLRWVYATTARPREMIKAVETPNHAASRAWALAAEGARTGFLFGAERAGLENHEISHANAIVTVPVNPAFYSLNLAQCVLLISYEWGRQAIDAPPVAMDLGKTNLAARGSVDRFVSFFENELDDAGFFWPAEKKPHLTLALRNMFARADLTDQDVRMLYGAVKSVSGARKTPKTVSDSPNAPELESPHDPSL